MKHTLPELGFSRDALLPHFSAETFDFHYDKHHRAYVDKLNGLIQGSEHEDAGLEDVVRGASGAIADNAGQHFNHSFYWRCLTPGGPPAPQSALATAIESSFGSLAALKSEFTTKAATLFGSGWCWLVRGADGRLAVEQTSNAASPLLTGGTPLLTCDVWEHAYYIDFRNARPKYVEAFWSLANWDFVRERFES